jgi:hypothetical protein
MRDPLESHRGERIPCAFVSTGAASSIERGEEVHHLRPKAAELVAMYDGQLFEQPPSGRGQRHVLAAQVVGIGRPHHEPGALGPVDELDGRVVAQLQRLGEVADDRPAGAGKSSDGQEQLVLRGGGPGLAGGLLGEVEEPP